MLPKLEVVTEGRTQLYVPSQSLSAKFPATHPVFFNPVARTNRDISVAVAAVTRPRTYLDVLAGVGARGVRVANETPGKKTDVTLVDFSTASIAVARKNVRKSGVGDRCSVVHKEANAFLTSRFGRDEKFEAVDLDPFGTPAPYVQATMMAAADGGVVSLTATDAAVLCGVYPEVSVRRYGALAVRSEYVHESAVRILLGFAVRMGGINDIGIEPVLAHSTLHYLRVTFRVRRGATHADASVRSVGYLTMCHECGARSTGPLPLERCPGCGLRVRSAGPLWTGKLVDEEVLTRTAAFAKKEGWRGAVEVLDSLEGVDRFPPYSYSNERICSRLKIPSVPVGRAIDALIRSGFVAERQPFEDVGIKTDAGYADFVSALRAASGPATKA